MTGRTPTEAFGDGVPKLARKVGRIDLTTDA